MSISDRTATKVGRTTLAALLAAPVIAVGGLILSDEYPHTVLGDVVLGVALGVGFLAWSVARYVMVAHQAQCGHVAPEDIDEWERRRDTKAGGLVPFIYLLASPEQRRVLAYLGERRRKGRRRGGRERL